MSAVQLELFKAKPPKPPADDWGVVVNECRVFATTQGGEWWLPFLLRFEPTGRMTCLMMSIAGGLWHVACGTREDAESLAGLMASNGVPKSAVCVKRLSQCARGAA